MYGCEKILWKEKERLELELYRWTNSEDCSKGRIRELCGVTKGVDERIDEVMLWWFGHIERMENDSIAKRVYVGECAGSRSVGKPWKRWIDIVKLCL